MRYVERDFDKCGVSNRFANSIGIVALVVVWALGCDAEADKSVRATKETTSITTAKNMNDADHKRRNDTHHVIMSVKALQNIDEAISHAINRGREASARRTRVQEGLQKLIDDLPESDPSADRLCEQFKYPCSSAEVPEEINQRTTDVGLEIADRIEQGESVDEVLEWLLQQDDIAYIRATQWDILFQLKGGFPMPVVFGR